MIPLRTLLCRFYGHRWALTCRDPLTLRCTRCGRIGDADDRMDVMADGPLLPEDAK